MSGSDIPDPNRKKAVVQLLKVAYMCSDIVIMIGPYEFATTSFIKDLEQFVEHQTEDVKSTAKPALLVISNRREYTRNLSKIKIVSSVGM